MNSIEQTRALEAVIRQALADDGIEGTETTIDVTALPGLLEADALAVLVNAPTISFETYTHATFEHKVWCVAGPPADVPEAWARLAPAVDSIALHASASQAEPSAFTDPHGTTYPAYIITIPD